MQALKFSFRSILEKFPGPSAHNADESQIFRILPNLSETSQISLLYHIKLFWSDPGT